MDIQNNDENHNASIIINSVSEIIEIWKNVAIDEFNESYEISNMGKIRNTKTKKHSNSTFG